MSGFLDLLNGQEGKTLIDGMEKNFGINKAHAASAMAAAMPLILGAMKNNAKSPDQAGGLLNALTKHGQGGLLDNIQNLFNGGNDVDNVLGDGEKILKHLFNGQEENISQVVGKQSGVDSTQISKIMKMAAPFVLSFIGKRALNNNVKDPDGLNGMLHGLLGDDADTYSNLASKIQDFSNNDDTIDGISELLEGNFKKTGSIGKLMNDLLG